MHRLTAATVALLLGAAVGCSDQPTPRAEPAVGEAKETDAPETAATETLTAESPSPTPSPRLAPALADALRDGPTWARTPGEVVAQIVAAEQAIADPTTKPAVLAAAGHLQQVAYRQLGRRPKWDAPVRAALPAGLRTIVADNVASRREFRSMHQRLSDRLPAWRIVRPARARTLRSHYRLAEKRFGVDWEYLAAINLVETGMGRIRGTSVAGAQGPMQFIPTTWDIYGKGDINSARDSILAAGRFLRSHGFTRPGGKPRALYRYNNSNAYVRGVTHLARVMERRPRAFLGYYHWQVYFVTTQGDVLLPVGYESLRPIPVRRWLATHP